MGRGIVVRPSEEDDVAAIQAIYAHHVLHGSASFETEPPDRAEMARRRRTLVDAGFPHLVAEWDGAVVGFAYAGPYRPRIAYRWSVEDSVYVVPEAAGRGIGKALLSELILRCTARGFRQMIAVIGDSGNVRSVELHRRLGFVDTGVLRSVGYKFGRWLDTVVMQRALGPSDTEPPDSTID